MLSCLFSWYRERKGREGGYSVASVAGKLETLCHACRVSGNLSTLCKPTSKVLEFPFEPLHFAYTGVLATVAVFTNMRSTHKYEKAISHYCNLTLLKKTLEYILGLHFWKTDSTKSFAAALRAYACAWIRPWIFFPDMIHVDWLHEPCNFTEIFHNSLYTTRSP